VKTKCDSFDDEIICDYRASAEATCSKGPPSVENHDASTMAVKNQHKALKKILEFCDREPENFYISCDPGEQIIPLNDSQ
jgi:hypothetical protein